MTKQFKFVKKSLIIILIMLFLISAPVFASADAYKYDEMPIHLISQWVIANESVKISFEKTGGLDRDAAIESVWTEMKKDPSVWANVKHSNFSFKDRGNGIYDMIVTTEFHHNKVALESIETFAKDWASKNINPKMTDFEKVKVIYKFIWQLQITLIKRF